MSLSIRSSISYYDKVSNINSQKKIPLDIFLEYIRDGKWEDYVHKVRVIKDKKKRDEAKKEAPSVTISGLFTERKDAGLKEHSGYIAVDVDSVGDPEKLKRRLSRDKYVAACFVSISGRGLCLLFKINPDKHREAFYGISEYMFREYEIICDPTSVNPSRARFVSYDPHIYIATRCDKFVEYPKEKPPKKIHNVVYSGSDFENILQQIVQRKLNITQDSYHTWYRICFSIVEKFGESGRQYFHIISQYSSKYDPEVCDKQYTACLRHHQRTNVGSGIGIATFYYYCKQAGLEVYSERTIKIAHSATHGKKGGLNAAQIKDNLKKFEDIEGDDVEDIIKQVIEGNIYIDGNTELEELEMYLRQNYDLRLNEITRYIEDNSKPLEKRELNSIFIKAKKIIEKVPYDLVERMIYSDFVPVYNPLKSWFAEHVTKSEEGAIPALKKLLHKDPQSIFGANEGAIPALTALFRAIQTPNSDYALYFGVKWFVGMVSGIYGEHSPLMYVLSGAEQNTGKTEWFRRLLPPELFKYYAESKLDAGKDDEILMTQKLLIMDDEMGGKSKREEARLKELTSKQVFSLREPYGRNNVDLVRLAALGGTSNHNGLISDPTGNRRIVPVRVEGLDHKAYNAIDKRQLLIESYCLLKAGFNWRLDKADIKLLADNTDEFQVAIHEAELIYKFFKPGKTPMTATDMKIIIEKHTQQKISLDRLGKELKRLGFEQKHIKALGGTKRVWLVETILNDNESRPNVANEDEDDDLPF